MKPITVAVIGGTGIYNLDNLKIIKEKRVRTPFGNPSDAIIIGEIDGRAVAFLPRHGRGHCISPTELNNRANIYALKSLGVSKVISISAVGSLREEIKPGHFVIPDQLFDHTKYRPCSFFGDGAVGHIGFADPFCPSLSTLTGKHAKSLKINTHLGGTYVCIEGPQFSTRAESHFFRSLKASVIGMTALPEAKLAREAELCYVTIALATDYDVWKGETVSVEMVLDTLKKNSENVKKLMTRLLTDPATFSEKDHPCQHSLENAIMTSPDKIPQKTKQKLKLLIGRYVKK
ncbi:MAG: S-methyl-5'-thioadenosine phosphorylase [Candidatus Wallbacteria bacterium]|nr:S-methyl-5'-thioadenosine phosphorylase [Candidatus Wallbacteria bacterium]